MRTTSLRLLAALVVLGGVAGWSYVSVLDFLGRIAPSVPWTAPAALGFFAAVLFGAAWFMYDRVHRSPQPVDPLRAVRLLVLAKASAIIGSLAVGAYAGFGAQFLAELDVPLPRERVIRAAVTALAGLLVVVAALLLERACRVPGDGEQDHRDAGERSRAR